MEWAARAIGVFYVLAGLMLMHQAWLNWRLQRALAGFIPISATEHVVDMVTALGGLVVLLAGLTLSLLSAWAVVAFMAGWAIQAGYLLWASRWAWPREAVSTGGRRHSVHAFAGFTAVTAFVLVLPLMGLLR